MPKEKSIGAILFHRSAPTQFLLLQYSAGHWDFCKGHPENQETEQQTLLRELKEETSILPEQITILPNFNEKIQYFFKSQKGDVFKDVKFFLVEAKTKEIKLSFEHRSFQWLPLEEAIQKATFKTAKQLLKKAGDFLEKTV